MLKVEDFRRNAADCRRMASTAKDANHRKMLEDMAAAWETLAAEREKALKGDVTLRGTAANG
jgi:hypothetical protein